MAIVKSATMNIGAHVSSMYSFHLFWICDLTYMWKLKSSTKELTYKTETDSQTQKTNLWLPRREEGERNWKLGINRCLLPYVK